MPMTPPAQTLTHDWVRYTVQSVAVIVDPFTGGCCVVTDDGPQSAIGEQVGCSLCGEPLSDSSAAGACTGEEWANSQP